MRRQKGCKQIPGLTFKGFVNSVPKMMIKVNVEMNG